MTMKTDDRSQRQHSSFSLIELNGMGISDFAGTHKDDPFLQDNVSEIYAVRNPQPRE